MNEKRHTTTNITNYYSYRFRLDENDENNPFTLQTDWLRLGGEERSLSRILGRTLLSSPDWDELSVHLLRLLREGDARGGEFSVACVVPWRKRAVIATWGEEEVGKRCFRTTFVGLLWIGLVDEHVLLRVLRELSNVLQHGGIWGVLVWKLLKHFLQR